MSKQQEKNWLYSVFLVMAIQAVFAFIVIFKKLPEDPGEAVQELHRRLIIIFGFFLMVSGGICIYLKFFHHAQAVWG